MLLPAAGAQLVQASPQGCSSLAAARRQLGLGSRLQARHVLEGAQRQVR